MDKRVIVLLVPLLDGKLFLSSYKLIQKFSSSLTLFQMFIPEKLVF